MAVLPSSAKTYQIKNYYHFKIIEYDLLQLIFKLFKILILKMANIHHSFNYDENKHRRHTQ